MMVMHHPVWVGPVNAAGQPHGTSITRYGTEHMQNGMLHDRGDEPAQTTILPGGEIETGHYKMDIRVGERVIKRHGVTVLKDVWSMGVRNGPAMRLDLDGWLITQSWQFGRLHGIATATDNDGNISLTNFVWGKPVSTSFYARQDNQRTDVVLEEGKVPVALGAAALVELSDSSESDDVEIVPPTPARPAPREAQASIPRSRVIRREGRHERPQRVRKVPARYRSSHY